MKRVIVNFQKLNNEILELLVAKYPYGYSDDDIISFKNAHNEVIEAVEVRTEDTIYLVKISKRLVDVMESFESDIDDDIPVDDKDLDITKALDDDI